MITTSSSVTSMPLARRWCEATASRSDGEAGRDGVAEHVLVEQALRLLAHRARGTRRGLARDEVDQVAVGRLSPGRGGEQVHHVERRDVGPLGDPHAVADSGHAVRLTLHPPARCRTSLSDVWSVASENSVLSLWSQDSVLSIGSAASFGSIGSVFSFASAGSIASALSSASLMSFQSNGSALSHQSNGSILSSRADHALLGSESRGRVPGRAVALAVLATLAATAVHRVRRS